MLKKVLGIIIVFACLPFSAFCAFAAAEQGPAASVAMLQKAIETNDLALAEKYLDIDAVLDKGVQRIVVDEKILRNAAKYPAISMALALGPGTGNEILRTLLGAEAREYIRYGIVSGAFAGKPRADAPPYNGIFKKAFRGGDKDKRSFGKTVVTKIEGDAALLKTSLIEGRNGKTHPLELVARKQEGVWRIVDVSNAAELFGGEKKGDS